MKIINQSNLDSYLKANFNVLFEGAPGVGKTASILEAFERHNLKYAYLSCPTMDPYLDFVGVPRVVTDANGKDSLKIIQPERFANDEIEVIFLDELNRAPDKVLNAIMELIQFKSINGKKFNNLRAIWGAINPQTEEQVYKVNELDPAFLDRFHVRVKVPFDIDTEYFESKYPDEAKFFIDWWKEIDPELRHNVSPRRLEYAIMAHKANVRIEDVLHSSTNVSKLRKSLKSLSFVDLIKDINDEDAAKKFLKLNNISSLLDAVKNKNGRAIEFFNQYKKFIPEDLLSVYKDAITKKSENTAMSLKSFFEGIKVSESDTIFKNSILKTDTSLIIKTQESLNNDVKVLSAQYPKLVKTIADEMVAVLLRKIRDPSVLLGDKLSPNLYNMLIVSFIRNRLIKTSKVNEINSGLMLSKWTSMHAYFIHQPDF